MAKNRVSRFLIPLLPRPYFIYPRSAASLPWSYPTQPLPGPRCAALLISRQYIVAMMFSMFEYYIEINFFSELKIHWWISNIGLVMILIGEVIRKLAILTAGRAFTHLIRIHHNEQHELITQGIYRFIRHPGYCGFFIWSVGTQLMLCNPISIIGFMVVLWRFFSTRIPYEEFYLRQFFGPQYIEYAKLVPSGLPFIE